MVELLNIACPALWLDGLWWGYRLAVALGVALGVLGFVALVMYESYRAGVKIVHLAMCGDVPARLGGDRGRGGDETDD
jgi:hypothetical protein